MEEKEERKITRQFALLLTKKDKGTEENLHYIN